MSAFAVLLKAELVAMLQIVKSRSFVPGEVEMFRRVSLNDVSVDLSVHWILIVHGFKDVEFFKPVLPSPIRPLDMWIRKLPKPSNLVLPHHVTCRV